MHYGMIIRLNWHFFFFKTSIYLQCVEVTHDYDDEDVTFYESLHDQIEDYDDKARIPSQQFKLLLQDFKQQFLLV